MDPEDSGQKCKIERLATIGGTFNDLHQGHQEYIQLAFAYADQVIVYVTSDNLAAQCKTHPVRPYESRKRDLQEYLGCNGCRYKWEIRCLNDLSELTDFYLSNPQLNIKNCLAIVTPEYYEIFREINKARLSKGMKSFLIAVKERSCDENNLEISTSAHYYRLLESLNSSNDLSPREVMHSLEFANEGLFRENVSDP